VMAAARLKVMILRTLVDIYIERDAARDAADYCTVTCSGVVCVTDPKVAETSTVTVPFGGCG
jgi:hypothetical protein